MAQTGTIQDDCTILFDGNIGVGTPIVANAKACLCVGSSTTTTPTSTAGVWRNERLTGVFTKTLLPNTYLNFGGNVKGGTLTINDGTTSVTYSTDASFGWGDIYENTNTVTLTGVAGTDLYINYILK